MIETIFSIDGEEETAEEGSTEEEGTTEEGMPSSEPQSFLQDDEEGETPSTDAPEGLLRDGEEEGTDNESA